LKRGSKNLIRWGKTGGGEKTKETTCKLQKTQKREYGVIGVGGARRPERTEGRCLGSRVSESLKVGSGF